MQGGEEEGGSGRGSSCSAAPTPGAIRLGLSTRGDAFLKVIDGPSRAVSVILIAGWHGRGLGADIRASGDDGGCSLGRATRTK